MGTSRAVLVTGCSSGIGRASALALVRAGLPVWATARSTESLADLEKEGCRVLPLDVTDEESRARAVSTVEAEHGAVGALVNNAGYSLAGSVEELPLDAARGLFETNVFGLMRMCQLVLPAMRAQGDGVIVNMGSGAGLATPPGAGGYAMTKYALESLSDALRFEVRPFGVRVALIEPGAVRTRFISSQLATSPQVDPEGPYAGLMRNVRSLAEREGDGNRALPPEAVAKVVVKAVTAKRPKTRYKVGSQAHVGPTLRRVLTDRQWDALLRRIVK
jgi:NAD(P)-dependent dehydrogenase (short-subunit alcohol dehydrogenase family)